MQQLQGLKSGSNFELKNNYSNAKNKTYEIERYKMCLLCSGKCVCSVFTCLH